MQAFKLCFLLENPQDVKEFIFWSEILCDIEVRQLWIE